MRTNENISITQSFKNPHNAKRVRIGKTAKDLRSGSHQRRFNNLEARAAWSRDTKAKAEHFPAQVMQGNGNSSNRRPERRPGKAA